MGKLPKSGPWLRRPSRPPTPTTRAGLVPTLTSQRDLRTLAAAASAITLSITPVVDTRDIPSDGAADHARDTGWRTAYAAVRMAIEIGKESSDMFLPLEAAIGGVSALIRNFEVSNVL